MTQIEEIKQLKDEKGLSFRQIAHITGLNRKTVAQWYRSRKVPVYKRKHISPVEEKVLTQLKHWLKEDLELIDRGKRKRIRAASTMWADLVQMGLQCGESTIRRYMRKIKPHEVYIPLEHEPGEEMQVDWGIITLPFKHKSKKIIYIKVNIFVATLPFSNTIFVYPYMRADQSSFFNGHQRAFEFFGGIPKRITYDNLSSAVKKILTGTSREEQNAMLSFKHCYNIETNYCAPGKGNEKGSVENGVGYVKRRYLGGSRIFEDFQDLRAYLHDRCTRDRTRTHYRKKEMIEALLNEEQGYLSGFPPYEYIVDTIIPTKSDSRLLVSFDGVKYSIPSAYVKQEVFLRASDDTIRIYESCDCSKEIAVHTRSHKAFESEVYDFRHYLPVLLRKSRALSQAACIRKGNFPQIFWDYLSELCKRHANGNREMVRILMLYDKYPLDHIFFALEWCHQHKSYRYDAVLITLRELTRESIKPEKITKRYPQVQETTVSLAKYDSLCGGAQC